CFYTRAVSVGLCFDRSPSGSDAVSQYPEPYRSQYASVETCPEEYLLWFHHVPWDYVLSGGDTMWNTLCRHYQHGVDEVDGMVADWISVENDIADKALYADVLARLEIQAKDARWWKDACLLYFQQFSRLPIPADVAPPTHTLEAMKQVSLGIDNYTNPGADLLDSCR
ncbi:MAG: alpha-glucuronidase, partial [Muribaculaceae bacterium]|nr:alpha-glucuronidase [Muribaculaceae bacterium]